MKKCLLILSLLIMSVCYLHAQSAEGDIFTIASRVHVHIAGAQLQGPGRCITAGFTGYTKDMEEMAASFDRFILHDQDMVIQVEALPVEEDIQWYKFYLSDLADANDFQLMLSMHGIKIFYLQGKEIPVSEFSRVVYTQEKEKYKKQETGK